MFKAPCPRAGLLGRAKGGHWHPLCPPHWPGGLILPTPGVQLFRRQGTANLLLPALFSAPAQPRSLVSRHTPSLRIFSGYFYTMPCCSGLLSNFSCVFRFQPAYQEHPVGLPVSSPPTKRSEGPAHRVTQ